MQLSNYLKEMLDIDVNYSKGEFPSLPNYIHSRYDLKLASLNGANVVFVYPKNELEQIETLKIHLEKIRERANLPAVLILKRITYRQRQYLIREKIPFIVEGKQIYLPFLAILLQERCDAEKEKYKELLPSSQLLLLYFIYGGNKEMLTSTAAKDLGLTNMSLSRASRQLEELDYVKTKREGTNKIIYSDEKPEELFNRVKGNLLNPVKRKVYIPKELLENGLESGLSALASYSMISEPSVKCYAVNSISKWKNAMSNRLMDSKNQVEIELWRYDPHKLSNCNFVDKLSLALSFNENFDERVAENVNDMLYILWRDLKKNDKRN